MDRGCLAVGIVIIAFGLLVSSYGEYILGGVNTIFWGDGLGHPYLPFGVFLFVAGGYLLYLSFKIR